MTKFSNGRQRFETVRTANPAFDVQSLDINVQLCTTAADSILLVGILVDKTADGLRRALVGYFLPGFWSGGVGSQ